ncbi:MAG: alpha/beta fold hydrolase [Arcicella sp.]|nr:alpha/beta fold hydrolase [Arcicella sp.]
MPILQSSYLPSNIWRNPHVSTIYPSVFRKVNGIDYNRERLELSDGDFLDIDWSKSSENNIKLAIFTHGFLGNSTRPYVLGGVKAFNLVNYDALVWNHRGLGGENNRFEKITTHGSSGDLEEVINYVLSKKKYTEIILVGYSKGGNISLKYAGEKSENIPIQIKKIIAISSPTDLQGSVDVMGKHGFYSERFKTKLVKFLLNRSAMIDNQMLKDFSTFKYLDDFTDNYIAPLHGFKNGREYYEQCAAMNVVDKIRVPTFILNAKNDPVLSESCAMLEVAKKSDYIFSELPKYGGHCGFYQPNSDELYWGDRRMIEFVTKDENFNENRY